MEWVKFFGQRQQVLFDQVYVDTEMMDHCIHCPGGQDTEVSNVSEDGSIFFAPK